MSRDHGGPDAHGVPRWDFSTNANACGPAPQAVEALGQVDVTRYPDPSSAALKARLAAFEGVHPRRIAIAASASEFIGRLTAAVKLQSAHASVFVPAPGYGDYGYAADAWGLRRVSSPGDASLVWVTEPASPAGQSARIPMGRDGAVVVVDEAYSALRLEGERPAMPSTAWRLVSPNKALGLTGVRGAYAVLPDGADAWLAALERLSPSWPLGAHGVAMLAAWTEPATQQWVRASLDTLRSWKAMQLALGAELGWSQEPGVTAHYVARWPGFDPAAVLRGLRDHGIKLRDTTSMGLPGAVRLGVRPPEAQAALRAAWRAVVA